MFSSSLFAFCAGTCILYHLRSSWVLPLAMPWGSSRSRYLLGVEPKLPACTNVSHSPGSQRAADISVSAGNRAHLSGAAMCYRTGKPHIGKIGKRTQIPNMPFAARFLLVRMSALQEMTTQVAEILCHLVFHARIPSLWKALLWIGVTLLESKVSYWFLTNVQLNGKYRPFSLNLYVFT